ncbi:MAG: GAF domain-containing protein [Gammaproteobacteria bacterium]|nr:GAF domain-containing protein [Gammaproteobacteria bacterium]
MVREEGLNAARHLAELERLGRLHAALHRINQAIMRSQPGPAPRQELFLRICRALVEEGGFALAWIGWRLPTSPILSFEAFAGPESAYLEGLVIRADDSTEGRGPSGTALREGRPQVCNDFAANPHMRPWESAYRRHRFESSAAFPISAGGEIAGVLTVYAYEANYFRDEEVALLVETAADLSFALDVAAESAERERAQVAEHRELAFSSALLESLPGIFYFYDDQGRFVRWNRSFGGVTGYAPDEIAGMRPLEFIAAEDRSRVGAAIERVFATGEGAVEGGLRSRDGRITPYYFTGRRLVIEGRTHLLGVGLDISERKRAEREILQFNQALEQRVAERTRELEVVNRELESFSYSVSHDLRAPLRAISGFAGIVLADHAEGMPQEGRALLERIHERAIHMGQLIDDLLAFSRIGRQPLRVRTVDVRALVERAIEDLQPQYADRRVEFEIGDLPSCCADPKLLAQVWVNLLSNAVKFTRERDPARVRIGCRLDEGERLYYVADNGAGFDARYADKLFGVFQRLHRADEFEGTGVGLAIVHNIVSRHRGRVTARSEEGRGATFEFTIGSAEPECEE